IEEASGAGSKVPSNPISGILQKFVAWLRYSSYYVLPVRGFLEMGRQKGRQVPYCERSFIVNDKEVERQPKTRKKLVLNKETIRVLTEQELVGIEGGFKPTYACSGANTCACGGTCGNNLSTCAPL